MPGILLPWQIVIVISVIAGVALGLGAFGRRPDRSHDRSHQR
jgi:hypothetical protein